MKDFRIVIKTTIVAVFLLLSNFNVLAQEDEIVLGKVQYVYDGDTYLIKSEDNKEIKVRLLHIDCPEKDQTYGKEQ